VRPGSPEGRLAPDRHSPRGKKPPYGKEAPVLPAPHTDGDAGGRPALLTYARPNPAKRLLPGRGLAGFPRCSVHAGTQFMVPQPSITSSGSPGRLGVREAERSAVARPGRTAAQQVATIGRRHRFGNAR